MPHTEIGSRGRIVVIAGLPGAGKTTAARALAEQLDNAAHVEADEMQRLIVSGSVWPEAGEVSATAEVQLRLRLRHACLLARSFAEHGFDAVIDDIIIGNRVDHLLQELRGIEFHLVTLVVDPEVLIDRWRTMGSPFIDEWQWMHAEIQVNTRRLGLWLDTTDESPDEVVTHIVARLDEAVVDPVSP